LDIGIIDEPKATLRVLLVLLNSKSQLEQKDVIDEAKRRYGIGKTTTLTAIKKCEEAQLINVVPEKRPRQAKESLLHSLTEKGERVAKLLAEIENLGNRKP